MLIYGVIIASLLFNAEWSIAQSSPQKKSHTDETLQPWKYPAGEDNEWEKKERF